MTDNIYSIEHLKEYILDNKASEIIDECEESLQSEENKSNKVALLINMALAKLSLQMTRNSIKDLQAILILDQTNTIASFFLGLAQLWLGHENEAITAWNDGLCHGGPISYFSVMKRLTFDCNARVFIYSRRFDLLSVLDFIEDFDKELVYMDNDVQKAYNELRNTSLSSAISHFNMILANDPENIDALKGRGSAECLTGQWRRAIEDLTKVIEKGYTDNGQLTKIRSIAYSALGQYTAAITDLSLSISLSNCDWAGRVERARLHMIRKCYALALEDYTSVPSAHLSDQMLIDLAECYYAVGDVPHAAEVIMKVKANDDHRKAYCHYLVTRDVGHMAEASIQIVHAASILPSFFLLKTAADFMYEQGKFQEACNYYRIALKQKENDADTQRMYALSLFQSGAEIQAVEILKKLEVAYMKQTNDVDFGYGTVGSIEIDGSMKNFYKSRSQILRKSLDDLHYMYHIMNNSGKSILEAARQQTGGTKKFVYDSKIYESDSQQSKEEKSTDTQPASDKKNETASKETANVSTDTDNTNTSKNTNDNQNDSKFTVKYMTYYPNEAVPTLFHFSKFQPTKDEIQMLEDADRLGSRCMPHAPEVIDNNKRIIRCLGFCVLCLAQNMRQDFFVHPKKSWKNAFDLLRAIMSLADIKNQVRWTFLVTKLPDPKNASIPNITFSKIPVDSAYVPKEDKGTQYFSFPRLAPVFYIQKGERRSPRFGHAMQQAINKIATSFSQPMDNYSNNSPKRYDTSELVKLNSLDAIYSVAQEDVIYSGSWIGQNASVPLQTPIITLRYLGVHGYDLFVKPPVDLVEVKKYDLIAQESWTHLMEQHSMETSFYLPLMMMLIWLWQPISNFSNEFGHVLMHAYLLASKNAEVEKIPCQSGELFIKQMTNPRFEQMKKVINDHLMEAKVAPMVREQSLLFWKKLPTIDRLYPLIDYDITE
ncbi:hypothetical protein M9Y10_037895 [Tritrichomonas musculus]|uniref:TPR Domain containing protein n=1 Tax=Tritrichomonas musculus TaxID=1915356 RepID=A0ABR2K8Q9_9EUKA